MKVVRTASLVLQTSLSPVQFANHTYRALVIVNSMRLLTSQFQEDIQGCANSELTNSTQYELKLEYYSQLYY